MTVGANLSTGAEAMVRMLAGHAVRHIFGLCGDTSLPFHDPLAQVGRPGAEVAAAMGDGSFGMCAGELEAIAHDGPTLVDVIAPPLRDAAALVGEWVA